MLPRFVHFNAKGYPGIPDLTPRIFLNFALHHATIWKTVCSFHVKSNWHVVEHVAELTKPTEDVLPPLWGCVDEMCLMQVEDETLSRSGDGSRFHPHDMIRSGNFSNLFLGDKIKVL